MVKYGYCKIGCQTCSAGIAIKTNINRDSKWEPSIHRGKCSHFEFWCDLYTNTSIIMTKDEIIMKCYAKCLRCEKVLVQEIGCKAFDNKETIILKECHGHTAIYEYKLDGNTSEDYLITAILIPIGLPATIAKVIVNKIGEHLELFVFAPNPKAVEP